MPFLIKANIASNTLIIVKSITCFSLEANSNVYSTIPSLSKNLRIASTHYYLLYIDSFCVESLS